MPFGMMPCKIASKAEAKSIGCMKRHHLITTSGSIWHDLVLNDSFLHAFCVISSLQSNSNKEKELILIYIHSHYKSTLKN